MKSAASKYGERHEVGVTERVYGSESVIERKGARKKGEEQIRHECSGRSSFLHQRTQYCLLPSISFTIFRPSQQMLSLQTVVPIPTIDGPSTWPHGTDLPSTLSACLSSESPLYFLRLIPHTHLNIILPFNHNLYSSPYLMINEPMLASVSCSAGAKSKYSSRNGTVLLRMANSHGVPLSLMYPGAVGSISMLIIVWCGVVYWSVLRDEMKGIVISMCLSYWSGTGALMCSLCQLLQEIAEIMEFNA